MSEIVSQPLYVDYTLPPGWYRNVKQSEPGNWDVQISGHGRRFRSKEELEKYIKETGITEIIAEDVDFTIWGKGKKPPNTPPQLKTDIISVSVTSASNMAIRRPAWLNPNLEDGSDEEGDGDSGIDSTPEKEEAEAMVEDQVEDQISQTTPQRYDMPISCPYCDKILSRKDKLNAHIKKLHPNGLSGLQRSSKSPAPIKVAPIKEASETPPRQRSTGKLAPCPYCDKILSRTDKLNEHIKTQHLGFPSPTKIKVEKMTTPKPSTESKVKKKIVLEDIPKRPIVKKVAKRVVEDTSTIIEKAMEMAYTAEDPVFVKFSFPKPLIGRKRQNSEDSIDMDISPVYASFARSPVVYSLEGPPKKKVKIEAKKIKKKVSKTSKKIKQIKSKKGSFSCPHCSKVLSRRDKLNSHIKTKHQGVIEGKEKVKKPKVQNDEKTEDAHLSDENLVEEDSKELSESLLEEDSNAESKKFECKICDKVLANMKSLKLHSKTVHGYSLDIPKPYQCSLCDKSFKTKHYVQVHELTHTESYHCSICQKSFKTKKYVEVHEKNHQKASENVDNEKEDSSETVDTEVHEKNETSETGGGEIGDAQEEFDPDNPKKSDF